MSQLVRYKKGKQSFEIITKPNSVRLYKEGKLSWNKVLVADAIFINSKKGNIAKSSDLVKAFNTDDVDKCAQMIIKDGEAQVSATERKEDMKKHRQAIIGYLHNNYLDDKGLPHPTIRLESVLNEVKVRIDPSRPVQKQSEEIIKKMQGKLIFKKGVVDYTLILKHAYAKKCTGIIYKYCGDPKDSWNEVGCTWKLQIAPREFDAFMNDLNKITQGDYVLTCGNDNVLDSKQESGRKKKKRGR